MSKNHKYIVAALTFAIIAASPVQVFAGDINGNEASVISAAQGTFEYNGKKYVAKSEYVEQLRSRLSQDGVDLTAVQASEAIATIYGNVANGISNGYLVEVAGGDQQDETGSQPEGGDDSTDEPAGGTENPDQPVEETDGAVQTAEGTDGTGGTDAGGNTENADGTQTEDASKGSDSKEEQRESAKADLSNIKKKKQINKPLVVAVFGVIGIVIAAGIVFITKRR